MRTQVLGGWTTSILFAVTMLPRVLGSLIPLFMYLESNSLRTDIGGLQSRAVFGVIGLVMPGSPAAWPSAWPTHGQ